MEDTNWISWRGNLTGRQIGSGIASVAESLGLYRNLNAVMPTGRTAADKCPDCYMIHSNAQKECW